MTFPRDLEDELLAWSQKQDHKPLILRGARQVGKTSMVNHFSRNFDNYLYASLEKQEIAEAFEKSDSAEAILTNLFAILRKERKQGTTLLFLDEIQNSPKAVWSLRYFYEEQPNIHVVAAGSLLESLIDRHISFPVGRVQYKAMRPVSFREYLSASGNSGIRNIIEKDPSSSSVFHQKLLSEFNRYALIGGMPEVVREYIENHDLISLNTVYTTLLQGYQDDVEKYAQNRTMVEVIRFILESAWGNAGQQLSFTKAGKQMYKSREVGEAFRTLEKAMLMELCYPTISTLMPYLPNRNRTPKLFWLDSGLVCANAGIQRTVFNAKDISTVWKGAFAEQVVAQELLSLDNEVSNKRHFWVNEKTNSSAEIDLLYVYQSMLIPIEVKNGHNSHLRSLHQFVDNSDIDFAVRVWGEELSVDEVRTNEKNKVFKLLNVPFYMIGFLPELLDYYFGIKPLSKL